jgi:hypothetical protein
LLADVSWQPITEGTAAAQHVFMDIYKHHLIYQNSMHIQAWLQTASRTVVIASDAPHAAPFIMTHTETKPQNINLRPLRIENVFDNYRISHLHRNVNVHLYVGPGVEGTVTSVDYMLQQIMINDAQDHLRNR